MTELTSGADRDGYNPFTGNDRFPGADCIPGPLSVWKPYFANVQEAYNYAARVYAGIKDKSLLNLLAANKIGS